MDYKINRNRVVVRLDHPDPASLRKVPQTCRHLTIVGDGALRGSLLSLLPDLPHLEKLALFACNQLETSDLVELSRFPRLQSLSISCCQQLLETGLSTLAACPSLVRLTILHACSSPIIKTLHYSPQIRRLELVGITMFADAVACIGQLTKLEALALIRCRTHGFRVASLSALHRLKELIVESCEEFSVDALTGIGSLKGLRTLALPGSALGCLTRDESDRLGNPLLDLPLMNNLTLDFEGDFVFDRLTALHCLNGLKTLRLYCYGSEVERRELAGSPLLTFLRGFSVLEELSVYGMSLTGDDLQTISELKRLRALDLSGWIDADFLHLLQTMPMLQSLQLCSPALTDENILILRQLESLEELVVGGSDRVTEAGLRQLALLPRLQYLALG